MNLLRAPSTLSISVCIRETGKREIEAKPQRKSIISSDRCENWQQRGKENYGNIANGWIVNSSHIIPQWKISQEEEYPPFP